MPPLTPARASHVAQPQGTLSAAIVQMWIRRLPHGPQCVACFRNGGIHFPCGTHTSALAHARTHSRPAHTVNRVALAPTHGSVRLYGRAVRDSHCGKSQVGRPA
eukprot:3190159-Pleurochrysis_carterae.AAC.1